MSSMYTLTAMTGREASASRTVVIGTVEFNWRVWMILVWTSPLAVIVTIILWAFIGQLALVGLPLVEGGALWLIHRRTRHGLRLRTYQAMWDKRKATLNQFFLCGQPIEINQSDYRKVMDNVAPYVAAPTPPGTAYVDPLPPYVAVVLADPEPTVAIPVTPPPAPVEEPVRRAPIAEPQAQAPYLAPSDPFASLPAAPRASGSAIDHHLDVSLVGREGHDGLVDVADLFDDDTSITAQPRLFGRTKDTQ